MTVGFSSYRMSAMTNIIIPVCLLLSLHRVNSFIPHCQQHDAPFSFRPAPSRTSLFMPSTTAARSTLLPDDDEPLPVIPIIGALGDDGDIKGGKGPSETIQAAQAVAKKFIPPTYEKSKEESSFIKSTLMTNFMFQSLPDKTLDRLVMAFEQVKCTKNSVVITQGDPHADYFYVLYDGQCSVTIDGKQLPEPYGMLDSGTLFGELAILYRVPQAATVSTKTSCKLFRVDRKTFRFFLGRQQPQEVEDVKQELQTIDGVIDRIAGVKTRYSGSIIRPYKPQRSWLWRRWRGTVLQHGYKWAVANMMITTLLAIVVRRRVDCHWPIFSSPDQSHPVIRRMIAFSKHWHYLQAITTFILTFFLSQSYSLWRELYSSARRIQGRLNDINFFLAAEAIRNEAGEYTPEAESVLDDVGSYTRLFHAFVWAKFVNNFNILLTQRGMSRMLSRGLMRQNEFNALQNIDQSAGPANACLEWITIRVLRGMTDGGLREDIPMKNILYTKLSELRGVYAGIGDILDGRIPLAYTHIVQILVDSFLASAPFALYAEVGVWSILSVGILTLFYSGLLDLAKIFLDPLDNDAWLKHDSVNMDIGVLIREGNAGSTRWKNSAALLPF